MYRNYRLEDKGGGTKMPSIASKLLVLALITLGCSANEKHYYSEGGSFPLPPSPNAQNLVVNDAAPPLFYALEQPQAGVEAPEEYEEDVREPRKRERLERILSELREARAREQIRESTGGRGVFIAPAAADGSDYQADYQNAVEEDPSGQHKIISRDEEELEQLRKLGSSLSSLADETVEETTTDDSAAETAEKAPALTVPASQPLKAAKKGQSEFVEFMEPPRAANQLRQPAAVLEKRVPADLFRNENYQQSYNFLANSGNVLFLAFITMCCVLTAVGVVGGVYYYNRIRAARDDPFDDFTRYSPAGPGRDKLRKGHLSGNGTGAFGGDVNGDDSLAYKAQLHHYQQTKQKIIGADLAASTMPPDQDTISDDEADLEHNFSVYECPGLAPTGDIEVQNPNFVGNAAEKPASTGN